MASACVPIRSVTQYGTCNSRTRQERTAHVSHVDQSPRKPTTVHHAHGMPCLSRPARAHRPPSVPLHGTSPLCLPQNRWSCPSLAASSTKSAADIEAYRIFSEQICTEVEGAVVGVAVGGGGLGTGQEAHASPLRSTLDILPGLRTTITALKPRRENNTVGDFESSEESKRGDDASGTTKIALPSGRNGENVPGGSFSHWGRTWAGWGGGGGFYTPLYRIGP